MRRYSILEVRFYGTVWCGGMQHLAGHTSVPCGLSLIHILSNIGLARGIRRNEA